MFLLRRQMLRLMAGAAALPISLRVARAQAYPSKPIRLVVQVGAGSAPDIIARVAGQWLSDHIGQPVVIGRGDDDPSDVIPRAPASADGRITRACFARRSAVRGS